MKIIITLLVGMLILSGTVSYAQMTEVENQQNPVVIVVVGAAGTPEYAVQFTEWAGSWEKACLKGRAKYVSIGLDKNEGSSDSARLQEILMNESKQTSAALWLVLIGHGTFDGRTA
ncbi:MAG: hypothetical protein ACYS6K_08770, partial [Planctomycetota bacterium]